MQLLSRMQRQRGGEEKRREEGVEIEVEVVLQGSQPVLAMTTPGSTVLQCPLILPVFTIIITFIISIILNIFIIWEVLRVAILIIHYAMNMNVVSL